jgi:hypothetical protein
MAATFDFTPKANTVPSAGTIYSTVQLKAFLITIKNDSNTAIDLRSYDAAYGSELDLILREIGGQMVFVTNDNSGTIHAIMDGHAVDAASLQVRLRHLVVALGLGTAVAANDTTVAEASSITLA